MISSTILTNCATWHADKAERAPTPEARARHAEIADRLFIRAYWASRFE